ncbi:MAG: hypothetical protein B7733_08890 [Myxococcales bacterium FL481]|nr:MAG: hypothetical protein B7733_08890 [Myxococcales bacterium FL481]
MQALLDSRSSLFGVCTHLTVAASLLAASTPAIALADEPQAAAAETADSPAASGGSVALLRADLSADWATQLRGELVEALDGAGFETKGVSMGVDQAAKKVKCDAAEAACLDRIGQYLNKNAKTPFDYYLFVAGEDGADTASIVVYDIANTTEYLRVEISPVADDLVLPIVLPGSVATKLSRLQQPPPPLTEEEKQQIATLDEPEKTPEEIAEEERILADATKAREQELAENPDAVLGEIDLKRDFKALCRKGPREDQVEESLDGTKHTVRDLRPDCNRGPFFGYWQPRAWATLGLAGAGALATLGFYGLALAGRSGWNSAKDDLASSGLSSTSPADTDCESGQCYQELAGAVAEAGDKVRRRALAGDVALGATVLLSGVLLVVINQDRAAAKRYLATQRAMNVSNLGIGPLVGVGESGTGYGAMAGFRF